ncbi:MAG: radical SAM protein, partial [Planctomycetes bacterium]|nr:radical SAM protein [Planctomycetota bacterium]
SFGMLGCDFKCGYCQNWITSQAVRDPEAVAPARRMTAREIVEMAERHDAAVVASTYNEPLITAEWAASVFRTARARGLRTAFVSNGNGTPEVLAYLRPHLDFYKVDLKGFSDRAYRRLGGALDNVLATIERLVDLGFWVEVVTLVVPGFNDTPEELRNIARFLAGVSVNVPWHLTAFHPDYKMTDRGPTERATLLRGHDLGREAGLRYVYLGNMRAGERECTFCHACGELLVERTGYRVHRVAVRDGCCPRCAARIPGVWARRGPRAPAGGELDLAWNVDLQKHPAG